MTKREKLVVSAYTGILLCDIGDLQKFMSELVGRQLFTHELIKREVIEAVHEKLHDEFIDICRVDTPEPNEILEKLNETEDKVKLAVLLGLLPFVAQNLSQDDQNPEKKGGDS